MNVVTFPSDKMDIDVLREVLRGGLDKTREAETPLLGGHTIKSPELTYGLSVTGTVHPDRVLTNGGAQEGDLLMLTKPLGTGIISTALKAELASDESVAQAITSMATLNRAAAEAGATVDVHACTDVTGFGLLGHAVEMIEGLGLGIEMDAHALPLLPDTARLSEMGLLPGGLHRNRKHFAKHFQADAGVPQALTDVVCDPQTSGGLLFAVSEREAAGLERALVSKGICAARIGRVVRDPSEQLLLK